MVCESFTTKRKSPFETNQNGLYFFCKKITKKIGNSKKSITFADTSENIINKNITYGNQKIRKR